MKKPSAAALLLLPACLCAQAVREAPPDLDAYLGVDAGIRTPPPVDAPRMDLGLKGPPDDRPRSRSSASVAEEVRANQAGLGARYKRWRMKGADIERLFGVSLTIGPDGAVRKAVVHGISDRGFRAELEAAILSWSFSPVQDGNPMTFKLKNLDFLYRKEVRLD